MFCALWQSGHSRANFEQFRSSHLNWSRIGISAVAAVPFSTTLPFQYKDGWLFSLGAECAWARTLTLHGGTGLEKSPITDGVRIPLLPDNDRYWASVGGTYK